MKRRLRRSFTLLAVSCLLIGVSSLTFAQAVEVEPNDPCVDAQDIGPIDVTGAFSVQGSLDAPPDEPDVDLFRFSATPGAQVAADHEGQDTGVGTLPDPLLGLFDTDCNLLAFNDDAGGGVDSRLLFDVPADGVFILAATSFPFADLLRCEGSDCFEFVNSLNADGEGRFRFDQDFELGHSWLEPTRS